MNVHQHELCVQTEHFGEWTKPHCAECGNPMTIRRRQGIMGQTMPSTGTVLLADVDIERRTISELINAALAAFRRG